MKNQLTGLEKPCTVTELLSNTVNVFTSTMNEKCSIPLVYNTIFPVFPSLSSIKVIPQRIKLVQFFLLYCNPWNVSLSLLAVQILPLSHIYIQSCSMSVQSLLWKFTMSLTVINYTAQSNISCIGLSHANV